MTRSRQKGKKLPALREFVPKAYRGGPIRSYLPLLYDLVAINRPGLIVAIGFDEGEAYFTLCQAVHELRLKSRCVAIHRADPGSESEDEVWQNGMAYGEEFYGEIAQFISGSPVQLARDFGKQKIDLLVIDDCDSGSAIRNELAAWKAKLAPNAIVLVHGLKLEREDSPKDAWSKFVSRRPHLELDDGVGLGLAAVTNSAEAKRTVSRLGKSLQAYRLSAKKIGEQARIARIMRENAALEMRQVWLDSVLADRWKAQEIMDHQARELKEVEGKRASLQRDREKAQEIMEHQARELKEAEGKLQSLQDDREKAQEIMDHQARELQQIIDGHARELQEIIDDHARAVSSLEKKFELLQRDRAQAQLIMDAQVEKLRQQSATVTEMYAQIEGLSAQIKEQKKILKAAKEACRNKGRCFQIRTEPKVQRSLAEKSVREGRRFLRRLHLLSPAETKTKPPKTTAALIVDPAARYATWIREHEPDALELEEQRSQSERWELRPKISLLVPVHNTSAAFLGGMLTSVASQTYSNWELCLVETGSSDPEMLSVLKNWEAREPKFRIERLGKNLGIAENTNMALKMAHGDFVACIDHDDLLAPFALYELARAINQFPAADIFYSDEDRWSPEEKRHSPFFKPEWSPALLQSSMYLGHLTAYRRDLVERVGPFCKEFDLSQDYDFALRATEQAHEIRHIPSVLYHWREHRQSGSLGGKPEARKSNLAALGNAMRRRNLPAETIEYSTANRARLKIAKWPKVSLIIPTDSREHALACLTKIPETTDYPDFEIVLVTHSSLLTSLSQNARDKRIRFVAYDKPFNFSDKCNLGAEASSGERLIFYNDDVVPGEADWIQNLIEPLENAEVGAVAPKMLYATGKIQHAGLVTGVRGLIGTAFHQRAATSTEHFNLAQSMRDVSALSAACLAMRRADFSRVGGFDAINTPIAHSDLDLCFKIREAGMRCVYTPFTTLHHAGHASLGVEEKKKPAKRRDKASIYLLKRWAGYTTHDPYFPENMRDWLFSDSPTPIGMAGRNQSEPATSRADLLFISHDLSASGAPMMMWHAARWCQENGFFVVVMSPKDGPLRRKFEGSGIPFIVDPLIDSAHQSVVRFARDFDCVVANTVFSSPIVHALAEEDLPVMWWLHETLAGEHYLREDPILRLALTKVDMVVVPSTATAAVFQPFRDEPIRCLPNAIPDVHLDLSIRTSQESLRFLLLGTIEPRKGQDVFVEALALLSPALQGGAAFEMAGRVMDPKFVEQVRAIGAGNRNFSITGTLSHEEALVSLALADVVVFPSRDEAMPTVTMLEAMSFGKAIISTTVGGAPEFLVDGDNALLVRPEAADELADAIAKLIKKPELIARLGRNARATYEQRFTMERFGARFCALVMETLAGSKNASTPSLSNS